MNELIRVENGEVKADSRMIAEHFEKEHRNVLADIKDEIEKIGEEGLLIFQQSSYTNQQKREMPCYTMCEEGLMQLAARYDAVARRKLIVLIKDLKQQNQQRQPQSQAEFIFMMAQQALEQEKKLSAIEGTIQTIKDAMLPIDTEWKAEINKKINRTVFALGKDKNAHLQIRHESYELLEKKAHADLERRVQNLQDRLRRTGATKAAITKASKLDVIEQDPKLKEIYTGVIQQLVIKYC